MNWLDGYGHHRRRVPPPVLAPPPPAPAAPPPRASEITTESVEMVPVPVCPKCRSRYLRILRSKGADRLVVVWQCRDCGHSWRGQRRDHIAAPRDQG
jgi:predicted RNA-binding Zn-ribbon protein involved in translation (DUF1610 family)